ncbi:hypothetical protein [Lysinibacillus sp. LZ02]|uniref:hypothetical protein n=1 Tax=Lysinibacillus sp. LZ02 TaxID=3420668 RepID=UPI003D3672BB
MNNSTELQISNCQSRWSSNKIGAYQYYDGFHFYNTSKFIINGCAVFGGNGTDLIDGGKGQTAFAISMSGATSNGKIIGVITHNVKGEIFEDSGVTNIKKASIINDNLLSGLRFVGNGSSSVAVNFLEARKNTSYTISITPTWNTSFWVTNVTVNGFTINFSTVPNEDKNCYWSVTQV